MNVKSKAPRRTKSPAALRPPVPARETPRKVAPALRLTVQKNSVTIWSPDLFHDPESATSRLFLSRVFSLPEIATVEIDQRKGRGRLLFSSATAAAQILRGLKKALIPAATRQKRARKKAAGDDLSESPVDSLFLHAPDRLPIHITRVGSGLSTWRVVSEQANRVRIAHPILRARKDVAYRLEEELTAVLGIRDFKINRLTSSFTVRFSTHRLDVPGLLRHLEQAWPRLMSGADGPPAPARLVASAGLLSLAFTAQYFVPPLTPFVLAGIALYGFTNVVSAVKLLLRGRVGLPLLYTGTLTFTIISGMPFSAALMATFMQTWPRLAFRTFTHHRRRLFATHLQQSTWARLLAADGTEVEIAMDRLRLGDSIVVYKGEVIPVDGVIEKGLAAVEEEALSGKAGALDKGPGDPVFAATFIKDGQITVRVTRLGQDTVAGVIGAHLPRGRLDHLPASAEAEHVAMNMVTPALALSGLNLLLTGNMIPSQTTIRPDYATAPRLSAQLAALHELGDALRRGILFRHPAALSRLPATDIYVFDDSAALERRGIQVGEIIAAAGVSSTEVLSYATSAFPSFQNERARALMEECIQERAALLEISERERGAGVIRYRDEQDRAVEVCSPAYVSGSGVKIPRAMAEAVALSSSAWAWEAPRSRGKRRLAVPHEEPPLRPLWIIREGTVLGVVTFHRKGELEAVEVIATLKARNASAQFLHISSAPQAEAEARAQRLGITQARGDLDAEGKAAILAGLGRRTMWIGDGAGPDAFLCVQASTVSISVAGAAKLPQDLASIVLLQSSLRSLVPLRRIGRRHRAQLKKTYRTVFTANLFCVAGAFFGGFTTLAAALISNSATGYVYFNQRAWLHDLVARKEAKIIHDRYAEPDGDEPQDDSSLAMDGTEQREAFLDEDLDGPIERENPI